MLLNKIGQLFVMALLVLSLAGTAIPAQAQTVTPTEHAIDATADALVGRPLGVVGTTVGSALYVTFLPFVLADSAMGDRVPGDARSFRNSLVIAPARWTFTRPLGTGLK